MLQEADVLLRPLSIDDKGPLTQLANNKKIADNLRDIFPHPYTENNAEFFIGLTSKEDPAMTFAIEFKGKLCGIIALVGQEDVYRKTAEIGYWIGEPYWNKGIATTAVKLITAHGFDELGFVRIHTGVFEYNTVSMKVLGKNGYQKEGVFKQSVLKNGKMWNEHRYAKLK